MCCYRFKPVLDHKQILHKDVRLSSFHNQRDPVTTRHFRESVASERGRFMQQKISTVSSGGVGFGAIASSYHMQQTQWPQKEQSA